MIRNIVNRIPRSLLYGILETKIGTYVYQKDILRTQQVTVACGGIHFEMEIPKNAIHWWNDYERNGCHEIVTTVAFAEILNDINDPVVWDIGSKFGYFMMASSQFTSSGNIHVFEKNSSHSRVVSRNNEKYLDGQANVLNYCVSDEMERGSITGDEYKTQNPCPDLIKIDVDGPEHRVLIGMSSTISECIPELLVEVHSDKDMRRKIEMISRVVSNVNYVYSLCSDHRSSHGTWESLSDLSKLEDIQSDSLLRCSPSHSDRHYEYN